MTCFDCRLYENRTQIVHGYGSKESKIVFIGEAPGKGEDLSGLPFQGKAGSLLDSFLNEAGITRDHIFITNVVRCKPYKNRDPYPDEIEICTNKFLKPELYQIRPRLIVTLGRYAMSLFIKDQRITDIHGIFYDFDTLFGMPHNFTLIPMFHPAATVYRKPMRTMCQDDYAALGDFIKYEMGDVL